MKAFYDTKPSILEPVGNGSFLYRYNIEEVETETEEAHTQWQCEEVTVYAPLTANKITEAVITDKWPSNYEQKLANEYEGAKLGVYGPDEAEVKTEAFRNFLIDRKNLKAIIDKDCKDLNIL